jgi:peptidoglycan/xylan/chitin deacetylase (PgdA/CDA1 family)
VFGRLLALGLAVLTPAHHYRVERPEPPVPILMYHVIANPIPGSPYPGLYVSRQEFDGEVRWLARHGYRAVTLMQVVDDWRGLAELPRKPVVLSFDDGYHSDYTTALPALRALRWPGVLNLEVNNTKRVWGLEPGLVRALLAAGWELDAHTITHPDLTHVATARLWTEVAGSRRILQREFGVPVDFFCYPSGRYDAAVVADVRRAGYLGATTTRYGLARPAEGLYTLDRVRVSGGEGVSGLAAALRDLR